MSTEDELAADQPVELTAAELEVIAGGIDVSFTAVMFEQSEEFSNQQTENDSGESSYSSHLSFSIFQFTGSFKSMGSVMRFINRFSKLFGR